MAKLPKVRAVGGCAAHQLGFSWPQVGRLQHCQLDGFGSALLDLDQRDPSPVDGHRHRAEVQDGFCASEEIGSPDHVER